MLELLRFLPLFFCISSSTSFPNFFQPNVAFNHMARDPGSGYVYVGAVNRIYQLSSDLDLLVEDSTGPQLDSPECLPFKDPKDCLQASSTPNFNKLLIVNTHSEELLTCGHVFQGICDKRNLHNISNIIYRTVDPGDNQFVAANDPHVSTVGIVERTEGRDVMFVGRGLTARLSSGIPPITIRQLNKSPIFSNDGLGKLVVGDFSDYNNTFVGIFSNEGHVYFLFYRRGSKSQMEYKTYLGSVCSQDLLLYSYVEVPLVCNGGYNLAQAAHLETLNRELFVVFAATQGSGPVPSNRRALCSYKMEDIEKRVERARSLCYTNSGKGENDQEESGIEYGVNSKCGTLPEDSSTNFPCGGEHTPSPIASRISIDASPLLTDHSSLTAVTAMVEDSNTIVFLGNAGGNIDKVFVSPGQGLVYNTMEVVPGSAVSPDLLLDESGRLLYVMTESQVTRVPVAECSKYDTCDSCHQARDPFCGWCVLEGKCTQRKQCDNYLERNHWLWSFDNLTHCPIIEDVVPANQSRQDQTDISMTVLLLPALADQGSWQCLFDEWSHLAHVEGNQITCPSPPSEVLPPNQQGKDHVTLKLALLFHDITVAVTNFTFYDCGAVMELSTNAPCGGCVSSPWRCNWCLSDHRCTHTSDCGQDQTVIYSQNQNDMQHFLWGPDACPRIERIVDSRFIPVGIERKLDLIGRNFHLLEGEEQEYRCAVEVEGNPMILPAHIERVAENENLYQVHCDAHKYEYPLQVMEQRVNVYAVTGSGYRVDNEKNVQVILYNCSVGQPDCSRCHALDPAYSCLWCGDEVDASCVHSSQCEKKPIDICPTPLIMSFFPQTGIIYGGTTVTINGVNMGQKAEEVSVKLAGHPCDLKPDLYVVSNRIVCTLSASDEEKSGPVEVIVNDRTPGVSNQLFTYQDPVLRSLTPTKGPMAGGTIITIFGSKLSTGDQITVTVGDLPCKLSDNVTDKEIHCKTNPSPELQELTLRVFYGTTEKVLEEIQFNYTENPTISSAVPSSGFYGGGRLIMVSGSGFDVVQHPLMRVLAKQSPEELRKGDGESRRRRKRRRRRREMDGLTLQKFNELCILNSSSTLECMSPSIPENLVPVEVLFILDNIQIAFSSLGENFTYHRNPTLRPLNRDMPNNPYSLKPGNVLDIEGEGLDSGISKQEVIAMIGDGICAVRTLTHSHLYCDPPLVAPQPLDASTSLPEFVVQMGKLQFNLGTVKYDVEGQHSFPKEAIIGLAVGGALLIPVVLIIIFMYRRQSKMAMKDYKKVLVQLENLETSVGDQCKKEFTDLMTEMMDLTSDLEGSGIPNLDYKTYVERIFFPGHTSSPLRKTLDVPESKRVTVEQGLTQLCNLLNNKLFLTKLIETLDAQPTLSQRDRCHAASLLTVALHGKLEYLTDVMKTLLIGLIDQCVAKNPKLLLRRTETIVEKLLTNWMAICLHSYLREAAAEPLYMLFCAIKYQVDKGPVDAVTGKAKRTLNDGRLLREDIEYRPMTLTVLVKSDGEMQRVPVRVLDTDTITQVKQKILNHVYKGTPFSKRPPAHTLDLEWRSGNAGHLTLSDEDLTSLTQGQWKRLNTVNHYKVPDNATVALIPRLHNNQCDTPNNSFLGGEKTPMLEDGEDGGIKTWHLVKSQEEPEVCKNRRSSLRERERPKAVPEIYLTRLLSMKGTLQKFVDDTFQVMLGVNRPVPISVKYFFDFLDEMAEKHEIEETDIVHIWKTHSLMQRFWVLILKHPQMVFDVEVSENVDSILSVIAQTFIDSCTISEHKVGRDSPVNKLLYAREIPRYKQLVEKYYSDIKQTAPASYQEMNSSLTELSGIHSEQFSPLVALHELYNYIIKYYDQISAALEEDPNGQKMQLAYRLQQISSLVENKKEDGLRLNAVQKPQT
ncbi:plexin-B3 isoform X2 [Pelobates cultripes]|uniref:Plexin-B3 isoform X2 n=1 Tax=Pelobates cultripes TaxID=61616 RepID=A0AAD1WJX9_PELCU|nr:plexin-B3 isoform X2 [Pelobates cultripes]